MKNISVYIYNLRLETLIYELTRNPVNGVWLVWNVSEIHFQTKGSKQQYEKPSHSLIGMLLDKIIYIIN